MLVNIIVSAARILFYNLIINGFMFQTYTFAEKPCGINLFTTRQFDLVYTYICVLLEL